MCLLIILGRTSNAVVLVHRLAYKVSSALNHPNIFFMTTHCLSLFLATKNVNLLNLKAELFIKKSKPSIKNYLQMTMPFQETAMT